jgi:hypothetical protein
MSETRSMTTQRPAPPRAGSPPAPTPRTPPPARSDSLRHRGDRIPRPRPDLGQAGDRDTPRGTAAVTYHAAVAVAIAYVTAAILAGAITFSRRDVTA